MDLKSYEPTCALSAAQSVIVDATAGSIVGTAIGAAGGVLENAVEGFFVIVNDEEEFVPPEFEGDDVPDGSVTLGWLVFFDWYYDE